MLNQYKYKFIFYHIGKNFSNTIDPEYFKYKDAEEKFRQLATIFEEKKHLFEIELELGYYYSRMLKDIIKLRPKDVFLKHPWKLLSFFIEEINNSTEIINKRSQIFVVNNEEWHLRTSFKEKVDTNNEIHVTTMSNYLKQAYVIRHLTLSTICLFIFHFYDVALLSNLYRRDLPIALHCIFTHDAKCLLIKCCFQYFLKAKRIEIYYMPNLCFIVKLKSKSALALQDKEGIYYFLNGTMNQMSGSTKQYNEVEFENIFKSLKLHQNQSQIFKKYKIFDYWSKSLYMQKRLAFQKLLKMREKCFAPSTFSKLKQGHQLSYTDKYEEFKPKYDWYQQVIDPKLITSGDALKFTEFIKHKYSLDDSNEDSESDSDDNISHWIE